MPTESTLPHTDFPDKALIRDPGKIQRSFFWLAGARWELLRQCPPAEQERVAVLGSTLLIPTAMAFLGMFFFARSRFENPPLVFVWISTGPQFVSASKPSCKQN
jgi:hypothetical protein